MKLVSWGLRTVILMYAILHFLTYFYGNPYLLIILSVSGFFIITFATISFGVQRFKLPLTLFFIGATILFFSDAPFMSGFLIGIRQMRDIVGFIVIIPIISWVLRERPYIEAIMSLGHKLLNTSRKLYFGIASFTQVIAYFLIFGSISMMYQFVNMILKNEEGEVWEQFKGTAILRGFSLSVMWVVSIPSFIFVVEVMNAPLWISILQGMMISLCGILLALLFSHFEEKHYGINLTESLNAEIEEILNHLVNKKETKRLVIEFFLLFFSLFGTIFLLNGIFDLNLMILIPMVILFWTICYYGVKRKIWRLLEHARTHITKNIITEAYQLSVMIGAGTMIFGLNQTSFGETMVNGIYYLYEVAPFINILALLPIMLVILGFFGLGPLTVMVLVGGILENLNLPYPSALTVLAISSGSAIAIMLSPMIMPNIMLSSLNGLSSFKNGLGFNLKFAIGIYILVQVYVQTMIFVV